ncbi:hypothetical protein Mapa_011242 [Marchantia paleacea]|nr:hypothetical protein Mapa_011242 [Marchantia paleacea]
MDPLLQEGDGARAASGSPAHAVTAAGRWCWQPAARFYCRNQREFFAHVPWVHFTGCIYTLPKLFAAPVFRPSMEALFPDRMASTWVLRSVVLPSDAVRDSVLRIDRAYLRGAGRRVGIQVRYKDGQEMYYKLNDLASDRIADCVLRNKILPNLSELPWDSNSGLRQEALKASADPAGPAQEKPLSSCRFRKGSLRSGAEMRICRRTRSSFYLACMISCWSRRSPPSEDWLRLMEVSLRGTLSTESDGLVHLVSGFRLWTSANSSCPHEPDIHDKRYSEVVAYIKDCLTIDHPPGIQVISYFFS